MIYFLIPAVLLTIFIFLVPFLIPAIKGGDIYYPTDMHHVKTMLNMVGDVDGRVVYDLGSGDGRIVRMFGAQGAVSHGVEINLLLVLFSRFMSRMKRIQKTCFHWESFWDTDISKADVVALFIIPPMIPKMEEKLKRELKPGSRVVSYSFTFPSLHLEKELDGVYLYSIV